MSSQRRRKEWTGTSWNSARTKPKSLSDPYRERRCPEMTLIEDLGTAEKSTGCSREQGSLECSQWHPIPRHLTFPESWRCLATISVYGWGSESGLVIVTKVRWCLACLCDPNEFIVLKSLLLKFFFWISYFFNHWILFFIFVHSNYFSQQIRKLVNLKCLLC